MSWLSTFMKKDTTKLLLKLAEQVLKIIAGAAASSLNKIAQEEVARAEFTGKDGLDKFQNAFKNIKARLPEVKDSAIRVAVELAVQAYKAKYKV